ncbi:multicopper oxidase domain-containing protein [Kineosporia sp. J2-2]|uniref:Multicopper oxidase domain-containing protein n=1 Tax=Kineosporia corallincola TaxID=2835133 RepID=A0ABS5TGB1_9ACTN|nr:multicopper oxidase domain-containing protein [Kineosporia corallincola]MBT0770127.1 multicopper oxidase domain-containing protein [Kineosporia corallincola]
MLHTRRDLLRLTLLGATAPALLTACGGSTEQTNAGTEGSAGRLLASQAPLPEPFTRPLPLPRVLEPVRSESGTDYYEITQKAGKASILDGLDTEVWGYDGTFPGPTIVSRRGRRTVVRHTNELPVPVVVHLHGGRIAADQDGYPTDLVNPAQGTATTHTGTAGMEGMEMSGETGSRDYVYDLDQPAATLWYHDHRMDFTGPQVYRGLAGFHLIEDDEEAALGLPSGERDVPLMIVDRSFAADGSFRYPSTDPTLTGTPGVTADYMSGVLGDCVLVNGAAWPVMEVEAVRYRFRILNAANARRFRLRLDGGPSFVQIGSDQGLLAAPVELVRIDVAQGERFDVVVDFSGQAAGDEITMVNDRGEGGTAQVMRFRVTGTATDDSRVPERLADLEQLSEADAVASRTFTFRRGGAEAHGMTLWTVNGEAFDPDTVIASPKLGTVERWTIVAQNNEHPFHVHLGAFQVLASSTAGRNDEGWKDTVNLDNGGRAEILVRFDGHRGKYVLHCHNLEHEDMMMMANFEVV